MRNAMTVKPVVAVLANVLKVFPRQSNIWVCYIIWRQRFLVMHNVSRLIPALLANATIDTDAVFDVRSPAIFPSLRQIKPLCPLLHIAFPRMQRAQPVTRSGSLAQAVFVFPLRLRNPHRFQIRCSAALS